MVASRASFSKMALSLCVVAAALAMLAGPTSVVAQPHATETDLDETLSDDNLPLKKSVDTGSSLFGSGGYRSHADCLCECGADGIVDMIKYPTCTAKEAKSKGCKLPEESAYVSRPASTVKSPLDTTKPVLPAVENVSKPVPLPAENASKPAPSPNDTKYQSSSPSAATPPSGGYNATAPNPPPPPPPPPPPAPLASSVSSVNTPPCNGTDTKESAPKSPAGKDTSSSVDSSYNSNSKDKSATEGARDPEAITGQSASVSAATRAALPASSSLYCATAAMLVLAVATLLV
ncbi:hypothetical protein RI367_002984 [Sorochytrium milnesiophthora]